jgi:histone H3/H4
VKEILEDIDHGKEEKHKITKPALMALQEATEAHVVRLMTLATHCTIHGDRVTLQKKDFDLVK